MKAEYEELLKECIFKTPLALLSIKDEESIRYIRDFLPYSTGFEIECDKAVYFNSKNFEDIPNIIHVNCSGGEQRFRIPYGINGFICLYLICNQLKSNCLFNSGSGIHYHVDMTGLSNKITPEIISNNKEWILQELDLWEYKGTYNSREIHSYKSGWLGFRSDKGTAEFRCGEMSFDYTHLATRIISANSIIRKIKVQLTSEEEVNKQILEAPDKELEVDKITSYLKSYSNRNLLKLQDLKNKQLELDKKLREVKNPITTPQVDMKAIIEARKKKMV